MKITENCTGCRMCEQICNKNAISIFPNPEGFLEAFVDEDKCIGCRLCQIRCPQNTNITKSNKGLAFAVRYKDDIVLKNSASGGAFIGLARAFVSCGGYVAGVVYDSKWNAVYELTNDLNGLEPMQSSKYVQADTNVIYSDIKEKLLSGKKVLFAGTACQVAGLKSFLHRDFENLVTVDIICHGVTSPLMFNKYIQWLENKIQSKVLSYNFRSKKNGWGLYYTYTYNYNKRIIEVSRAMYMDPYYKIFLKGDAYRECCYKCKYSSIERISDITIGDFWGIEREHPSFFSNKGVSSVLINSPKGKETFDQVKEDFYYIESEPSKIAKHNENLIRPTRRNDMVRNGFYEGININQWFDELSRKYKPTLISHIKSKVPPRIYCFIKKMIQ